MVEPLWYMALAEGEQRQVFKALCEKGGWWWPQVAKVVKRGGNPEPNSLTKSQRSQQARQAAYSSWARTCDPASRTQAARRSFLGRFERKVDPGGKLPAAQRRRMAEQAKRAHSVRLGLESSRRRQRRPSL